MPSTKQIVTLISFAGSVAAVQPIMAGLGNGLGNGLGGVNSQQGAPFSGSGSSSTTPTPTSSGTQSATATSSTAASSSGMATNTGTPVNLLSSTGSPQNSAEEFYKLSKEYDTDLRAQPKNPKVALAQLHQWTSQQGDYSFNYTVTLARCDGGEPVAIRGYFDAPMASKRFIPYSVAIGTGLEQRVYPRHYPGTCHEPKGFDAPPDAEPQYCGLKFAIDRGPNTPKHASLPNVHLRGLTCTNYTLYQTEVVGLVAGKPPIWLINGTATRSSDLITVETDWKESPLDQGFSEGEYDLRVVREMMASQGASSRIALSNTIASVVVKDLYLNERQHAKTMRFFEPHENYVPEPGKPKLHWWANPAYMAPAKTFPNTVEGFNELLLWQNRPMVLTPANFTGKLAETRSRLHLKHKRY